MEVKKDRKAPGSRGKFLYKEEEESCFFYDEECMKRKRAQEKKEFDKRKNDGEKGSQPNKKQAQR